MKPYTSIEQSKKLIEIGIPADSADMSYLIREDNQCVELPLMVTVGTLEGLNALPCWSLAALLELMPKNIKSPFGEINPFVGQVGIKDYRCVYLDSDWQINHHEFADNPIDAVVKMIIWLKEQNFMEQKIELFGMKPIEESYVSFETAKLLKEKGFSQEYDRYHAFVYNEEDYEDEVEVQRMVLETRFIKAGTLSSYPVGVPEPKCYCPTQALAMRWLREVHHLEIYLYHDTFQDTHGWWFEIEKFTKGCSNCQYESDYHSTYEEACEAAILYCLKNLIK